MLMKLTPGEEWMCRKNMRPVMTSYTQFLTSFALKILRNKLPQGLTNILEERNERVSRGGSFTRAANWKHDSISYRLASRATAEMSEISISRSKKGLPKKYIS
jgi:hypothetical protein